MRSYAKIGFLIILLYLLMSFPAFSQPPTAKPQWEIKLGGEKSDQKIADMVGTKDNKILVNRGKYVDILDTFGNILKHNIKFEKEPIDITYDFQNVKFFFDGDSLYLKRANFLYLYNEEEENFEFVAKIPQKANSFGVHKGIFLIGNKNEIGINISFDKGKTWELRNNGIEDKEGVTKGSNYFAVTAYDQNVIYLAVNIASKDESHDPIGAVYTSVDYGENWKIVPELANLKTINIMRYADFVYIQTLDKDDYDYNPQRNFGG